MSLSQLRRRVDALYRKLAPELEVARLRRLAEDYCEEWDVAVASHQEPPPFDPVTDGPKHLAQRIAETGARLNTYMNLRRYLRGCRERGLPPQRPRIPARPAPLGRTRRLPRNTPLGRPRPLTPQAAGADAFRNKRDTPE